jgi:hypothetical protein
MVVKLKYFYISGCIANYTMNVFNENDLEISEANTEIDTEIDTEIV